MNKKIDFSKIYSPTRLDMFSKCPKSYHFYYLDPVYKQMKYELKKLPQNIYFFYTLGKSVHNAITLFYHLPYKKRTKEKLKELLGQTWRSEIMPYKKPPLGKWGGFVTIEEEREVYREALLMLGNFFKLTEIESEIEYLPTKNFFRSIDDYINLIIPLSDKYNISGKFDLIVREANDSLHVIDFKTGKEHEGDYFQLKFYKALAEAKFKKSVKRASFYFLATGRRKEFDLAKEKTEEIREQILEKITKINQTSEFETNPSKLCKFCLFKSFCPEKEKVNKLIKGVSKEDYLDDLPF